MGNDPYGGLIGKYKKAYQLYQKLQKDYDDNYENADVKDDNWDENNGQEVDEAIEKVNIYYDKLTEKGYNWNINPERLEKL